MNSLAQYETFRESIGNLAFLHGTLLIASTYQALWRGVPAPPVCYYHSALTIRLVNTSLESVEGQLAEGTLAAVACLVVFEASFHMRSERVLIRWADNKCRMLSTPLQMHLFTLMEWRH
jgi:hypothetical protein